MELAKDRIPNLRGLKHSSRELWNAHACSLIDNSRLQVLNGTDNVSLSHCLMCSTLLLILTIAP